MNLKERFTRVRDNYIINQVKKANIPHFNNKNIIRYKIVFKGRVQRVGFRMEVCELAKEFNFILPKKVEVKENPFSGKTLCVTGKLNTFTRDGINAKITELGAKAASSVSKNTDYLITNEVSGSSKYKKAVELNIPIITEAEFLEMCGE